MESGLSRRKEQILRAVVEAYVKGGEPVGSKYIAESRMPNCSPATIRNEMAAPGTTSGLDVALKVLKKVDEIGICELTSQDVVRHPVVQKIVKAYEDYENRNKKKKWEKR